MWVFLRSSFLSIVDPDGAYDGSAGPKASKLLVRSRFKGDIERVFPKAKVTRTPERDYLFRALIDRRAVADAMAAAVMANGAKNFKGSVKEKWRHDAYAGCWGVMNREQERQAAPPRKASQEEFFPDDAWPGFYDGPRNARRAR